MRIAVGIVGENGIKPAFSTASAKQANLKWPNERSRPLSPSGAHRWMPRPGSLVLEADCPDTSSSYADEGTAAHFLAAHCLRTGTDAAIHTGRTIAPCREYRRQPEHFIGTHASWTNRASSAPSSRSTPAWPSTCRPTSTPSGSSPPATS